MKRVIQYFLCLCFLISFSMNAQDKNELSQDIPVDLNSQSFYFDTLHLSINPPKHFTKLDSALNGFIHIGTHSSMVFVKTDPMVMAIAGYYTKENFSANGEDLISRDTMFLNNGMWAHKLLISFTIEEVKMNRIMIITGSEKNTIVAVANYPEMVEKLLFPVFIKSFKTMEIEN